MKKRLLISLGLLSSAGVLQAQANCTAPLSAASLSANNINARINHGGDLFFDGNDGIFQYQPIPVRPSSVLSAALWMGGLDAAGNLRLAALTYRLPNKTEYSAGPLNPLTGTISPSECAPWDKMFSTTKERITAFQANLTQWNANPAAAFAQFPDIMGWPGRDNPHFTTANNFILPPNEPLAPFIDQNGDGMYNPLDGDVPAVLLNGKQPFIPNQLVWCVFNDAGSPHQISGGAALGMEVQLTAWSFAVDETSPLNNTIFTSYRMINKSGENIEDFVVGMWTDFDLGCYLDDYIGCDPGSRTFFAYNQDAVDGIQGDQCNGTPTFGSATPVQTATFLDRSFDHFIYTNNSFVGVTPAYTHEPTNAPEYYYYLNGRWRDGSLYSDTTNYAYAGNPANPQSNSMCNFPPLLSDPRAIASSQIGSIPAGAINEFTLAWTLHPDIPAPCNIGNAIAEVMEVQDAFDNSFSNLSSAQTAIAETSWFKATPNPARNYLTLQFPGKTAEYLRITDTQGRLIFESTHPVNDQLQILTGSWPNGTYFVQWRAQRETAAIRIQIAR